VLLPMEWEYSHSITGRGSPRAAAAAASCLSCGILAYIGQTTSVAGVNEPPPCRNRQQDEGYRKVAFVFVAQDLWGPGRQKGGGSCCQLLQLWDIGIMPLSGRDTKAYVAGLKGPPP
jgi:hypothetical protein